MKDMEKIIFHPIRMRIIQMIAQSRTATVAALAEGLADIPRSTIYHHMGILCENQILRVVREQKVRGTYEKEYGLNYDEIAVPAENTERAVSNLLLKLYAGFRSYFAVPNQDPVRDQLFLSVNTLMLADEEFEDCRRELFDVIQTYMNRPAAENRRPRLLSVVSAPCAGEQKGGSEKEEKA